MRLTHDLANRRRHRQLGTDRPIMVQYATWIYDLIRGHFGESMWYGQPVWDELKEKFPTTLELVALALDHRDVIRPGDPHLQLGRVSGYQHRKPH